MHKTAEDAEGHDFKAGGVSDTRNEGQRNLESKTVNKKQKLRRKVTYMVIKKYFDKPFEYKKRVVSED